MLKKTALALLLTSFPCACFAKVITGVHYLYFYEDDLNLDISGVAASLGYKVNLSRNFSLLPELRAGIGFSEDVLIQDIGTKVDVKVNYYASTSLRAIYEANKELLLFASLSYANVEFDPNFNDKDAWEIGGGAGLGYRLNPAMTFELLYEQFDTAGIASLSLQYGF